jgi:Protein of unknown function (DUF968).
MYEVGIITEYLPGPEGTELRLFVPKANLMGPIVEKEIKTCGIWLDDGREISSDQRKKAHAMFKDISEWTGYSREETKQNMKEEYIICTGSKEFSLSNCSVDLARDFISFMLDFSLENGIWLSDLGIDRTDDIDRYLYSCLKHKRCCVCGKDGEIHHEDAIGMGNDRRVVDDSLHKKICACRGHHSEAHNIGIIAFRKKYKVYGITFKE